EHGWHIESLLKKMPPVEDEDWGTYDLIIFDEVQRLDVSHLDVFLEKMLRLPLICIFSFDRLQYLTVKEMENNIPGYIEERLQPKRYELKNIIRCSKEIQAFITNLFDLAKQSSSQKYPNISTQYFSSYDVAGSYLHFLDEEGWKVLDCRAVNIEADSPEDADGQEESFYEIIGQDYDAVAVVMDSSFYYNEQNKLSHVEPERKLRYRQTNMLFQHVTRARKKLQLVIIGNPDVQEKIMNILA
ncbi:MAG: ATP-binding protein, partial [Lysinibacillus sp.]